jgi:alpha-tubulin suppressor-like RCC1 family protein
MPDTDETCDVPHVGGFRCSPHPVRVPGIALTQISAGGSYTCGLARSGRAYCWGGAYPSSMTPVAGERLFVSIPTGGTEECGITEGSDLYCWSNQADGYPGRYVAIGRAFAQVSVEVSHACAVATDGTAYCWGDNRFG